MIFVQARSVADIALEGRPHTDITPVGFQNPARRSWPGLLCGSLVLVDKAAEDGLALDPLRREVGNGVVRGWRAQLSASIWSSPVVMPGVLG